MSAATAAISATSASLRRFWRHYGLDTALLLASSACFGLFLYRATHSGDVQDNAPVAIVSDGAGERRAAGASEFSPLGNGDSLSNLDAVWVGKGGHLNLTISGSGSRLNVGERTFMLIKKPFRGALAGVGGKFESSQFRLLRGEALVNGKKYFGPEDEASAESNHSVEIPRADAVQLKPAVGGSIFPAPGATLYMRPPERVPLILAWTPEESGYLAILNRRTNRMQYLAVSKQKSLPVELEQGAAYYWQLVGEDKKPLLGPYGFELRPLTPEVAADLLKRKPEPGVQIYW